MLTTGCHRRPLTDEEAKVGECFPPIKDVDIDELRQCQQVLFAKLSKYMNVAALVDTPASDPYCFRLR